MLKIHAALKQVLAESKLKNNWIVSLMKDSFSAMITALEKLIAKYDNALAYIEAKFDEFIGKVVTRVTGTPRSKGSIAKATAAPKNPTHAESQPAKPSAQGESKATPAAKPKEAASKKKNASVIGRDGRHQRWEQQGRASG
ncbi:hypothetical protein DZJ_50840 [Dickeya ananatis]